MLSQSEFLIKFYNHKANLDTNSSYFSSEDYNNSQRSRVLTEEENNFECSCKQILLTIMRKIFGVSCSCEFCYNVSVSSSVCSEQSFIFEEVLHEEKITEPTTPEDHTKEQNKLNSLDLDEGSKILTLKTKNSSKPNFTF